MKPTGIHLVDQEEPHQEVLQLKVLRHRHELSYRHQKQQKQLNQTKVMRKCKTKSPEILEKEIKMRITTMLEQGMMLRLKKRGLTKRKMTTKRATRTQQTAKVVPLVTKRMKVEVMVEMWTNKNHQAMKIRTRMEEKTLGMRSKRLETMKRKMDFNQKQ